jgi:hypothetical protein
VPRRWDIAGFDPESAALDDRLAGKIDLESTLGGFETLPGGGLRLQRAGRLQAGQDQQRAGQKCSE